MTRLRRSTFGLIFLIVTPLASSGLLEARTGKAGFELVGKIVPSESGLLRNTTPSVSLNSVTTTFTTRTLADLNGHFKFKSIPTGLYTLVVFVPRVRPLRKTVDVGPSFADSKGKIFLSIPLERQSPAQRNYTITTSQLSIPESARAEYRRAQEYLERGDTGRAIASLKRAVDLAPQFSGAWNQLGFIAYQSNQLEEAEMYYRQSLNYNPNFYGALVNLGNVLLSERKEAESLAIYTRALKLRPDDPMGHARVGLIYLYLGKMNEAEEHLKTAKTIEPGHYSFPQLILAEIYARRDERESALRELEEFLRLHPDSDRVPAVRKSIGLLRNQ